VFEIFSGPARQAIMLAQDAAIGLGDDFVGTEHLLVGLAGVPEGVAGQLLAERGLSAEWARARTVEARAAAEDEPGQGRAREVQAGPEATGQVPAGPESAGQRPAGPSGQGGPAIAPADALAAIGIDVAAIRERADAAFGPGEFVFPRPAYDAAARAAIEQSVAEAEARGDDYVGTGHMLLGLLAAGDNACARILGSAGLGEPAGRRLVLARTGDRRE
jgi:ATP-dependent Clp protease ATP-binding subunit ClpA